jgi:hypothetical protein
MALRSSAGPSATASAAIDHTDAQMPHYPVAAAGSTDLADTDRLLYACARASHSNGIKLHTSPLLSYGFAMRGA